MLASQFHESALLKCIDGVREGILDLSDRLRNICFVQGLASDRIQTIVRSRNYCNFDEITETALVEESGITSRQDRYRAEESALPRCGSCGKLGHSSNMFCWEKREARVNPVVTNVPESSSSVTCFRCREKGHLARHCRKTPRKRENFGSRKLLGNDVRRSESSCPTVSSTQ